LWDPSAGIPHEIILGAFPPLLKEIGRPWAQLKPPIGDSETPKRKVKGLKMKN